VTLQVTDFGQGKQVDQLISKITTGGGNGPEEGAEAYELAAYFFLHRLKLPKDHCGFLFITGQYLILWHSLISISSGRIVSQKTEI